MLTPFERKMIYAFLASLFHYPDQQTVEAVETLEEKTLQEIFPGLSNPEVPPLEELQSAYTGQFINRLGGVPAPPYGSVYLEKEARVLGQSTLAVAGLYHSAGLSLEHTSEPADYLPTELEFLYYLTEGEEQAREQDNISTARRWVASQADFFGNFFHPWVVPFCRRLADDEQAHPFYLWAAELLRRFTDLEKQRLGQVAK
ncbi:dehydrogenase [Desulfuromonas versatilis]|uniref:Dehydrogenase n=1 Tax=Desulfuromonas versatilis TaxID=2802975 RepID=A0ABM8HRF6_9BACT|nr:molecular chaperone TorD family protein [Desulfuromonas versatilis]BCR04503.1 dehydrogenase [Desulfuromonas versatilis]